jgi:dihydroorotase
MTMTDTLVIAGGRVIDPESDRDGLFDVKIVQGRVAAVSSPGSFAAEPNAQRVEARGKIVTPGLIDLHTHVYQYVTSFGVAPDRAGVYAGATSICDMGSSGHLTFAGLKHYAMERAVTDVYAFLMINAAGQPGGGQNCPALMHPDTAEVDKTVAQVEANRERIRGIKSHAEIGGASRWGLETFQRALQAARLAHVPLYAHTGALLPAVPGQALDADDILPQALPLLAPGDIVAHCFSFMPGTVVSRAARVHPVAMEAYERGVLFDVGHGVHFAWDVADAVLEAGIRPYTCGSDLHGDFDVPGYDSWLNYSLVGTMTRLLALGFSLPEVIRMATLHAATVLGITDRAGSLRVGMPGDVTLLDVEHGSFRLPDSRKMLRQATIRLKPALTIKGGRLIEVDRTLPEYRALAA